MTARRLEDLKAGEEEVLHVDVTADAVRRFIDLSGDDAPLHTDAAYAKGRGFQGTLVHGALIAAFVSRLVGTLLPGTLSLLQKLDLVFRAPCYVPCRLRLTATVVQVSAAVRSVRIRIRVEEESGRLLATGESAHSMMEA